MTAPIVTALLTGGVTGYRRTPIGKPARSTSLSVTDLTILEKASDFGGTWFHNSYPGAACDVPSHRYSFSYAQRRHWSRLCSPQREILDYLHEVAHDLGVDRLIVTGSAVTSCRWDDAACRWRVTTERGEVHESDAIVIATGQLHKPSVPHIEGAGTFAGLTFHSAEWDHGCDLTGKRVAVVGTGASAVQFVPEIAQQKRMWRSTRRLRVLVVEGRRRGVWRSADIRHRLSSRGAEISTIIRHGHTRKQAPKV
jgi:cation diffusion facilitator CzcD-associated flavoprotein CzcO